MRYLDIQKLKEVSGNDFRHTYPYPFTNPQGILTDEAFTLLKKTLPDISLFKKMVGVERGYGQKSHDRYELRYSSELPLSAEWKSFIKELESEEYCAIMAGIFGTNFFTARFQWQYAFTGCSVSPHCDSPQKLGSHIFYFNTPEDWKEDWGGQTLVLDDRGKLDWRTAPELSTLPVHATAETFGNRSFIFKRTDHSWHAVKELTCPEGSYRRLFTVVFNYKPTLLQRALKKVQKVFSGD